MRPFRAASATKASPCDAKASASFVEFRSIDTNTLKPPSVSDGGDGSEGVEVVRLRKTVFPVQQCSRERWNSGPDHLSRGALVPFGASMKLV